MKRSFTAVIEQGNTYDSHFETEPYEAGWATEARWFVRIQDAADDAGAVLIRPEISPDGLLWLADEGPTQRIEAKAGEAITFVQREFGNWLRLKVGFEKKSERSAKFLIYLVLKE
ncbi:conserved hypothetical protein [Hyphomicrobiales bacterium]|nr:conserved hypothetical protein [Hyphomicrobiales bacterium]CAH1695286.1 conserved hypothetical protein [Hyphomicrobiales bacterium]